MKHLWYVIGVLAVLVAIAIVVRGPQESAEPLISESPVATPTPEPTPEATATPAQRTSRRSRTPTPIPTPSYAEVAGQFASNRIQFDIYCQPFPVESTFLGGTDVMLDNRSPDDRVVALDGVQHGLRSYGWKVVTMPTSEKQVTWAIDCGTAKNVGKIVVEALATPTPEPLPIPASSSDPLLSPSPDASPSASESPIELLP